MRRELQGSLTIDFNGVVLDLLPERAVFCPESSTLFVADLHIGKEATFRRAGMAIPDLLQEDLDRLTSVISRTEANTLVVLGDFHHSSPGRTREVDQMVTDWRASHADLNLMLILGNHDRYSGNPLHEWNLSIHDDPTRMGNLALAHVPKFDSKFPTLAGHLHPKYRLQFGAERLNLPCFLQRQQTLVLPAFSNFVDHGLIRQQRGDQLYLVADDQVIKL
ncbi:MAG TPA: ligase-associated DNA damage response endonuclease PdeM [Planctomicrobium sp.]|nr:ligase-associated DNA damage response endonuclease PdeM [Planctomicrobium sp.]